MFSDSGRSINHKRTILHITPIAPPLGGVASQTALLGSSSRFHDMVFRLVRSNPRRKVEVPGKASKLFSLWPYVMHLSINSAAIAAPPDIVLISVNGDISFLRNAFLGYIAAKKSKVPLVIHMHASRLGFWHNRKVGIAKEPGFLRKFLNSLGYKLVNLLLMKASVFSQLTSDIDKYYQSVGLRPATHIIPNAVQLRNPNLSLRKANRFLFVGRLSREKGFFDLLEALAQINNSDWVLDVLGSPVCSEDQNSIQCILKNHPYREQIHLHDTVNGDAKWRFFDSSSFLVLPTHLEVFPNVILEAMASGIAVISTPIGEIENILPKEGCVLVQPGDTEALIASVSSFLQNSDKVIKMGEQNYLRAQKYSLDSVATQFKAMLIDALAPALRRQ